MKKILLIVITLVFVVVAILVYFNKTEKISSKINNFSFVGQNPRDNKSSDNSEKLRPKISNGNFPKIKFNLPNKLVVRVFADNIGTARDLQYTPDGTLLVSSPSTGTVYALPDKNSDGVADSNKVIISGENRPHGLAFYGGKLFVADVDKVVRFSWDESNLVAAREKVLFSLPKNNNHNNRSITFDKAGKMFVSVGSTCNVCRESSDLSATVLISNSEGENLRVFAKGLRNAPFIQFNLKSQELWGTEMGRDNLGDNIPPDEINVISDGKDYGWPNCFGDKVADFDFNLKADCGGTQPPIFQIPAHSAPLGLAFIDSPILPGDWQGDLLVSLHGSWNRSVPTGYKIVHMKVKGDSIVGMEDFMSGFIAEGAQKGSDAKGRPVDLIFDSFGNLYVSDDKAGMVYIIQKQ